VIHRDIKPENVLVHDGQPLIADFGIALAVSHAGGARLTETGLSIGTPHYMSPEQAMGDRELDARSDVYSLGAMLYEMLTGDPPYTGSTAQAIVAKVITEKAPPVTATRDTVPGHVAAAIGKALNKLPADRFSSAAQFSEALSKPGFVETLTTTTLEAAPEASTAVSKNWRLMAAAAMAVASAVLAILGWMRSPDETRAPSARFIIAPPAEQFVNTVGGAASAISPDGSRIVYVGPGDRAGTQLFMRRIGDLAIEGIAGTEGAQRPFFSPDGEWIGFIEGSAVKKVAVAGGPALTITRAGGNVSHAHWGADGTVVFESGWQVHVVPSAGGTAEVVSVADSTLRLRWPEMLPDGRAVLATVFPSLEQAQVVLVDLATGEHEVIIAEGTNAHYVPTGHIIYGHAQQALFAVPFDAASHKVTGSPTPVLEGVQVFSGGATQFTVSDNGTAVYLAGSRELGLSLILVGAGGTHDVLPAEPHQYRSPRFSPDGRYIAVNVLDESWDIYLYDIELGTQSRLTFEGLNLYPVWSDEGRAILFSSTREGTSGYDIFRKLADGSGAAEKVFASENDVFPQAVTQDGRLTLYRENNPARGRDLGIISLDGDAVSRPYLQADWNEFAAALSPDEQWVAYSSNESGANEIYVRAFPEPAGKWQVSQGGGGQAAWSPDGGTLYYWKGDQLFAATVRTTPTFAVTGQRLVMSGAYSHWGLYANYDVHPEGDRFIMIEGSGESEDELTVVVNWFDELQARMQH
jgi:serine/threonine-protein kinase